MIEVRGPAGVLAVHVAPGREPWADPVLFVHPANLSSACWRQVWGALGDRRTRIGVDLRAHGASARSSRLGQAEWAADVLAVMGALELGATHAIGASVGAA
ncbi:MAG: alpha/beta fold hydrolase, partial [Microbacterium sp.]